MELLGKEIKQLVLKERENSAILQIKEVRVFDEKG